ncbi:MAG: hypothetical protein NVSMB52_07470 [Chloroflexota bacterium]
MKWHLRGEYTRYEPSKKLAFTWKWDHTPHTPVRQVEIDFQELEGGGTVLTLHHGSYSDSNEDREERKGHVEGWDHFLGRLTALQTPASPD